MLIKKVRDVKTPTRGTKFSAGLDFYVPNDVESFQLGPLESVNIPSGLKLRFDERCVLIAFNKSGVAVKQHLQVGACVVDADYDGEVHLHVTNTSNIGIIIEPGQKLVQFILLPVFYTEVIEVQDLPERTTQRGEGGFGSTGK